MLEIPLLYKDRRLEGETTLRQCQLVQLHLLYVFDAICKEYNLTYFLGGGTLLGAMRHGGFIPWDDDLDVGMPMKDYKRFLKIAPAVLPKDVLLQTPKTNPSTAISFSKLRDVYSFYYDTTLPVRSTDCMGIFIDIFPYEKMPNIGNGLRLFLLRSVAHCYRRKVSSFNDLRNSVTRALLGIMEHILYSFLHCFIRMIISSLKIVFPCRTVYIQLENGYRVCYEMKWFTPIKMMEFEDGVFPVPNRPDAFLTAQYGSWREIPPQDKRPHHATIILPTQAPDLSWAKKWTSNV